MVLGSRVSRTRCATAWLAITAASAVVTGELFIPALVSLDPGALAGAGFAAVLVWTCALVGVAVLGWLWVVTSLVVVDAWRGAVVRRRGVPVAVHRATLVLCGIAVSGGLVGGWSWPALADAPVTWAGTGAGTGVGTDPALGEIAQLSGLRLPERATVAPLPAAPRPVPRHLTRSEATASQRPRSVIVQPGDTLWQITADLLDPDATDDELARTWPVLYERNRDLIGPDPHLIEPGDRLILPDELQGGGR